MKFLLSLVTTLFLVTFTFIVPPAAYAVEGTFTASDFSFDPDTKVLQFSASNFDPPRTEETGDVNDIGISLYNTSNNQFVLDYFNYNTGNCFQGALFNLTSIFDKTMCYNEFWHADLPLDDTPVYLRIAQSHSGNYRSQPIPANELLSVIPSPSPTPSVLPPDTGRFTASNFSFNQETRQLQFEATNFDPPRTPFTGDINDVAISLINSRYQLVVDYFNYNTGNCFQGHVFNLTTYIDKVVCYNQHWHADMPTDDSTIYLRIAQSASGNYYSQPIAANSLLSGTTTPPTPTPIPTITAGPTPALTPNTWNSLGPAGYEFHSIAVAPSNDNIIYAGTTGRGIFKSIDAGSNWHMINNGLPLPNSAGLTLNAIAVDPNNENIVYLGGGDRDNNITNLYKSTDGGANWVKMTSGINPVDFSGLPPAVVTSFAIDPTDTNIIYATIGVHCGDVYKSTDSAASWTRLQTHSGCDPQKIIIDPSDHNTLYLVGGNGWFHKSTDAGANWVAQNNSIHIVRGEFIVDPFNPDTFFAFALKDETFGIYKSTDEGVTWEYSFNPGVSSFFTTTLLADPVKQNTFYFGRGFNPDAYMTADNGETWTQINSGFNGHPVEFATKANGQVLYAATSQGVLAYVIAEQPTPTPTNSPTPTASPTPTNTPTPTPIPTYSINGTIYNDANQNGFQEENETGQANVSVSLNTGEIANTDANGNYTFLNVLEGVYTLTATLPAGFYATTQNPVADIPLSANQTVNVGIYENHNPTVDTITPNVLVVPVNTPLSVTATYSDQDTFDTHTGEWAWGDNTPNTQVPVDPQTQTFQGTHTYTTTGVYRITATVYDNHNGSGFKDFDFIVVSNPTQSKVTGSKSFTSPAGANLPNVGVVDFGFTGESTNGSIKGDADLSFGSGNNKVDFSAKDLDWITVTTINGLESVSLRATGTIKKQTGTYTILISAQDLGAANTGLDTVRIKLWNSTTNAIIYDSQNGQAANAAPTTTILTPGDININ